MGRSSGPREVLRRGKDTKAKTRTCSRVLFSANRQMRRCRFMGKVDLFMPVENRGLHADEATVRPTRQLVFVDVSGLSVQGERSGFLDYLVRIWDARAFMVHEARSHVRGSASENRLGSLWLIINPILDGVVYFVIFGLIMNTSQGIDNFIGFLLIGVFLFQLTSACVNTSASTLIRKKSAPNGLPVPDVSAPIVANIRTWMSGVPSYLVLMLMVLIAPPVENFSATALLIVPVIASQALLSLGLSLVAAHIVGRLPDLKNLLSVFMRAWRYGSGVMFAASRFADLSPAIGVAIHWNPMYWMLEHARMVLLYDQVPGIEGWLIIAIWTAGTLALGTWLMWRREGVALHDG